MKLYPQITIIFIVYILSILFVSYFGFLTLPHSGKFSNDFFSSFSNWDGRYYLSIAENGYLEDFQYAFFPLYPLLIKLLTIFTRDYLFSAVIISISASFLGFQILYKLVALDFDKKTAEKTVLALIFFPTSFYFLTAYSEGLFFLLAVTSLYFLRVNKLFPAIIFASLASATRITGLALVIAVLIEMQLTVGISRKNWYVLLAPLGFVIYCLFLYNQASDLFYFLTAEKHWQRQLSIPGFSFWDTIKSLTTPNFINSHFSPVLDLIFATLGLGLAIRSFRFLPISYSLFAILSVGLPLLTHTLSSIPRFLLPVFPIFILLGLIKNRYINLSYQVISLMILSIFTVLFINGYWVS